MKKLIIISLIIIAFVSNAQFYTEFNIGYSLPIQTDRATIFSKKNTFTPNRMYNKYTFEDEINDTILYNSQEIKFSMVQGISIGMTGGYILNKKFNFSINFTKPNKR